MTGEFQLDSLISPLLSRAIRGPRMPGVECQVSGVGSHRLNALFSGQRRAAMLARGLRRAVASALKECS